MKNFKSTAFAVTLAALSAHCIIAQGQSSGENTQRPDQPQSTSQSTNSAAQSLQTNKTEKPKNAGASAPSSSESAQSQQAAKSPEPQPKQNAQSQNPSQSSPPSGKIAPDPFKSDTQSTGLISEASSKAKTSGQENQAVEPKPTEEKEDKKPNP